VPIQCTVQPIDTGCAARTIASSVLTDRTLAISFLTWLTAMQAGAKCAGCVLQEMGMTTMTLVAFTIWLHSPRSQMGRLSGCTSIVLNALLLPGRL
jgi:hypothetical protein